MREQIIQQIRRKKVIAIVRGVYGEDCLRLAQALYDGGICLMEVTFDQNRTEDFARTAESVSTLCRQMEGRMIIGAGTVTTTAALDLAYESGAGFIVSPDVNRLVIQRTRELGLVSIPGAMTPTEILQAYGYGADFVKVFPTSNLGAGYIKAVRGPINNIPLLAVGGVSEDNIAEFLAAGAVGAGVGGNLVNKDWIRAGQFDRITAAASRLAANAGLTQD